MTWKKHKFFFGFCSVVLLSLFLSFGLAKNVSAVDNVPFGVYWRSYSINGGSAVNDQGYLTTPVLSRVILQNESGVLKNLYGVSLDFAVSDNTNFQNKLLTVEVIVAQNTQAQNTWVVDLKHSQIAVSTNLGDVPGSGGCTGERLSNRQVKYTCSVKVTGSSVVNNAQVVLGTVKNATSSSQVIAYTQGNVIGSNADLILSSLSYTLTGTNDPTFEQNETIISQNQTMISQNEQIIEQNQQTYDYITDDTPPSADTSSLGDTAGFLPPGPVDSILTIPITFIQGIIDVLGGSQNCQPVQLPLPFINSTLPLPCMKPIFDEIGITPLWNIVGGIISMFVIWETLKWLYKFVDDTLSFRENNSSIWGGL